MYTESGKQSEKKRTVFRFYIEKKRILDFVSENVQKKKKQNRHKLECVL